MPEAKYSPTNISLLDLVCECVCVRERERAPYNLLYIIGRGVMHSERLHPAP